jgi:hypothetical protein
MISKAAVPIDETLFPYTENIEKKKDNRSISIPISKGYLLIRPVNRAVLNTKMVQKNIPFRL